MLPVQDIRYPSLLFYTPEEWLLLHHQDRYCPLWALSNRRSYKKMWFYRRRLVPAIQQFHLLQPQLKRDQLLFCSCIFLPGCQYAVSLFSNYALSDINALFSFSFATLDEIIMLTSYRMRRGIATRVCEKTSGGVIMAASMKITTIECFL